LVTYGKDPCRVRLDVLAISCSPRLCRRASPGWAAFAALRLKTTSRAGTAPTSRPAKSAPPTAGCLSSVVFRDVAKHVKGQLGGRLRTQPHLDWVEAGAAGKQVRNKDSGTLQFDTYLNDDESECMVIERYRDSAAAIEHWGNFCDLSEAILATVSVVHGEVLGEVSAELRANLADGPVQLFTRTNRCRHRSPVGRGCSDAESVSGTRVYAPGREGPP
jgi:hypothetical protein